MNDTCGDCYWFEPEVDAGETVRPRGECFSNPPIPCYVGDGDVASMRPIVSADERPCQFFARASTTVQ